MAEINFQDFKNIYPDDDACLEWLRKKIYPEKIYCSSCHMPTYHHKIKSRKIYECDRCGEQLSITRGTIFQKSSTPLTIWFYTIFKIAETQNGITAKQIQRETGVTYKTAWRMCKVIREKLSIDHSLVLLNELITNEEIIYS